MNRVWKLIIIWIGGILIVLIAVHATLVAITGKRLRAAYAALAAAGRPMTAEEIIPKPIPEEDNGVPLYGKAFALLEVLEPEDWYNAHCGLAETNAPSAEALAAATAFVKAADTTRLVQFVEEAAGKRGCWFDRNWSAGAEIRLPECASMRNVTRLLQIKALVEAHAGDGAAAARSLVLGFKSAEAFRDDPILISQLVRTAQIGIMFETAMNVFGVADVPDETAAELFAQLGRLKGSNGFVKSMDGERLLLGEWAFGLFEAGRGQDMSANLTGETLARFYGSRVLRPMLQADHAAYLHLMLRMTEESRKPPHEVRWERIDLGAEIPRYCILTKLLLPALSHAADHTASGEARMIVAEAAVAAIRHRARHGAYADSPQALDKKLLRAWPMDPFSGKPLVYESSGGGFKIYSVGCNRTDNGGQVSDDRREGDIVWETGHQ